MKITPTGSMILRGIPLTVSRMIPNGPKLQIKKSCPMTDSFRREMNKWLLDTFGTYRESGYIVNYDNAREMFGKTGKEIFITQDTYDRIKAAIESKHGTSRVCEEEFQLHQLIAGAWK